MIKNHRDIQTNRRNNQESSVSSESKNKQVLVVSNILVEIPGGRKLIEKVSFTVNPEDCIGVIGEEGNGKSTLLKIMAGEKLAEGFSYSGSISRGDSKIGYLPQSLPDAWSDTPVDQFFLLDSPEGELDYSRYNELAAITSILAEFGFKTDDVLAKSMGDLSGGEKVKIQLAKIIAAKPDILLLDEPTNDVDIEFLEWMEKFISQAKQGIVVISHDETLLERTINRIVHLEQIKKKTENRSTVANVNFATYISQRQAALAKQEQQAGYERRKQKKDLKIATEIKNKVRGKLMNEKDATAGRLLEKRMKTAKRVRERVKNRELIDQVDVEEAIEFAFERKNNLPTSKKIADFFLEQLVVDTDGSEKILAQDISLTVIGPEKIVIKGSNGSGKTTLLRHIKEHIEHIIGSEVGYFPQNYSEVLQDFQKTAVSYLTDRLNIEESFARINLGRMNFTPEEQISPVAQLSGGQKAKLILLILALSEKQVLVLDEPTRNLSPLSTPVIRESVAKFPGVVITVTHDRKLIDELESVGARILTLTRQGLK